MLEIVTYELINGTANQPIEVTIDASETSVVISWEYYCEYRDNGCATIKKLGRESVVVELPQSDPCDERVISSFYNWNVGGETYKVYYRITKKPNPTYETTVEYEITSISGFSADNNVFTYTANTIPCGSGVEDNFVIWYNQITYENNCESGTIVSGLSATTKISLDCSSLDDQGHPLPREGVLTFGTKDYKYNYNCEECEGMHCNSSITVDESTINITELLSGGTKVISIPCSGISANVLIAKANVDIVITNSNCYKTMSSTSLTFKIGEVPRCEGEECCDVSAVITDDNGNLIGGHYAFASGETIDGEIQVHGVPIFVRRDTDGLCYDGCSATCESGYTIVIPDSGWTTYIYMENGNIAPYTEPYSSRTFEESGWTIYDNNNENEIPLFTPHGGYLKASYSGKTYSAYTNCTSASSEVSGDVIVDVANWRCPYKVYSISGSIPSFSADSCSGEDITASFQIEESDKIEEGQYLEMIQPILITLNNTHENNKDFNLRYKKKICSEEK